MGCGSVQEQIRRKSLGERTSVIEGGLQGLLQLLYTTFSQPIGGWVVWCALDVAHSVSFHEDFELISSELGPIVGYHLLGYAVNSEPFSQHIKGHRNSGGLQNSNFWPFGECVDRNQEH